MTEQETIKYGPAFKWGFGLTFISIVWFVLGLGQLHYHWHYSFAIWLLLGLLFAPIICVYGIVRIIRFFCGRPCLNLSRDGVTVKYAKGNECFYEWERLGKFSLVLRDKDENPYKFHFKTSFIISSVFFVSQQSGAKSASERLDIKPEMFDVEINELLDTLNRYREANINA